MKHLYISKGQSIQLAIDSIENNQPCTIHLANGVYREKVLINRPNVTLLGESTDNTIIVNGDYALKIHADGKEYNTFRTYTVNVLASSVKLFNLTISNDSGAPSHKGQAVALSVYANDCYVKNCKLLSLQDTVFCGPLPADLIERYIGFLPDNERSYSGKAEHLFSNCYIEGSVDFIFGCGDSMFYQCTICSVDDGRKVGYVCAPAHPITDNEGMTFIGCNFCSHQVSQQSIYLARPWRDYGLCAFIDCTYSTHINPLVFDKWNDTTRDRTARFLLDDCCLSTTCVGWAKPITAIDKLHYYQRYASLADRLND